MRYIDPRKWRRLFKERDAGPAKECFGLTQFFSGEHGRIKTKWGPGWKIFGAFFSQHQKSSISGLALNQEFGMGVELSAAGDFDSFFEEITLFYFRHIYDLKDRCAWNVI